LGLGTLKRTFHYSSETYPQQLLEISAKEPGWLRRSPPRLLAPHTPDSSQRDYLIGNRLPIVLVEHDYVTINPKLADIEFYRLFEVNKCYQELDMFIGGVLANNPTVDPIPDKYKIQQHGFDNKSFRKGKELGKTGTRTK
jgi:hypothetical protein